MTAVRTQRMRATDRRSGKERRAAARHNIAVDVEWEGARGRLSATLGDISALGAFVLTEGQASEGDVVKLFLPAGGGMKVQFSGVVENSVFEIGFGVRFIGLSDAHQVFLRDLIERHSG
jgi:hypothetical protein